MGAKGSLTVADSQSYCGLRDPGDDMRSLHTPDDQPVCFWDENNLIMQLKYVRRVSRSNA